MNRSLNAFRIGVSLCVLLSMGWSAAEGGKKPSKGAGTAALRGARLYISLSEYHKAIEQLEIAVQGIPDDAEARFLLGQVYSDVGKTEKMLESFNILKSMKDVKPKYLEDADKFIARAWKLYVNGARAALRDGEREKAIEELKFAIRIDGTKTEAVKLLADVYRLNKQPELFIETLEKALAMNPELADLGVYFQLSKGYQEVGNEPKQLEILAKVMSLADNVNDFMKLSRSYKEIGKSDQRIEALEKAWSIAPTDDGVALDLTSTLFKTAGSEPDSLKAKIYYDKTLKAASQALASDMRAPDFAKFAANIQFNRRQYAEAAGYFTKLWELDPVGVAPLLNAGVCYENLKNTEKAKAIYQKAAEADSSSDQAWRKLGDIRLKDSDYSGALAAYNNVVRLKPDDPTARLGKAKIYAHRGQNSFRRKDYGQAVAYFRKFLKIQPKNAGVKDWLCRSYFNKGDAHYRKRQYDAALGAFKRYVELRPNDYKGLVRLSQTYGKKGMMKEAMETTRKARAVQPK